MQNISILQDNLILFNKGIQLIESAMTKGRDHKTKLLLENTFLETSYSFDRYSLCFSEKFYIEAYRIKIFVQLFLNKKPNELEPTLDLFFGNNLEEVIRGFHIAQESLEEITKLCREDGELKDFLNNSYPKYNPFNQLGIIEFEKRFKGWSRAFFKEIREKIPRRQFERLRNKAIKDKKWYVEQTGGNIYVLYSDVIVKDGEQYVIGVADDVLVITKLINKIEKKLGETLRNLRYWNKVYNELGETEAITQDNSEVIFSTDKIKDNKLLNELLSEKQINLLIKYKKKFESDWDNYLSHLKDLEEELDCFELETA